MTVFLPKGSNIFYIKPFKQSFRDETKLWKNTIFYVKLQRRKFETFSLSILRSCFLSIGYDILF